MTARRTQARLDVHARRRDKALLALSTFPAGTGPLAGLPEDMLRALVSRGLAERRYVLTSDGRKAVAQLKAGQP